MCTAISMKTKDHYFGRNLDLELSYNEEVCVIPRNFPVVFKKTKPLPHHWAIIGMAAVFDNTPLFYDGANEHGLAMAGLNFPSNAYYFPPVEGKDNISPFEFIVWILGQCKTVDEAKTLIKKINLVNIPFNDSLPLSPLHWIISDDVKSIVVESMFDGIHIYNNPTGVLTNNPPFKYQLSNLKQYENLRTDNKDIIREENLGYDSYSQGLGALGLPGDVSSMSRFVRAAFALKNSVCKDDEYSSVGQFFHLLSCVEMTRGICKTDEGNLDITVYSSCINTKKGLYYYSTYDNRQISCVNMHSLDLESDILYRFPLLLKQNILYQNL